MSLYDRFFAALAKPLTRRRRVLLALLVIPLGLTFTAPLWKISLVAPQYPDGLELRIYAHTIDGDVREVNTLNHYIGMAHIDRAALSDLDWIPFAIGTLVLLTLRVAVIGNVRWLVDLSVLFTYFSLFSFGRFAYKLYSYGHQLDPLAPFRVDPFTPAILGTKQVANFTTTSLPAGGSAWLLVFALGLFWIAAIEIRDGARAAARGDTRVAPTPAG